MNKPIRISKAKDRNGYYIRQGKGLFGTSILAKTKEQAELVRSKIKNNLPITSADLK